MTYLVIEIQTDANGAVSYLVDSFTNRNQAEQKYHLVLSHAAVSTLPTHSVAILTNEG